MARHQIFEPEDEAAPAPTQGRYRIYEPPPEKPGVAEDVFRSGAKGAAEGLHGMASAPLQVLTQLPRAAVRAASEMRQWFGGAPLPPEAIASVDETARTVGRGVEAADAYKQLEQGVGGFYTPQTVPGQYARTIGEFAVQAPVTPGGPLGKLAQTVIPAITSETAGQVVQRLAPGSSPAFEAGARAVGGIAGALPAAAATHLFDRPGSLSALVRRMAPDLREEQLADAERLLASARGEGVNITTGQATGNEGLLSLERLAENAPGAPGAALRDFYATNPQAMQAAAGRAIERVSPQAVDPVNLGLRVQEAAQGAIPQTPQGRALTTAIETGAPRVTGEQAGAIVQPGLRQVEQQRLAARAAADRVAYPMAENAPAQVPIPVEPIAPPDVPLVVDDFPLNVPERKLQASKADDPIKAPVNRADPGRRSVDLAELIAREGGIEATPDMMRSGLQDMRTPTGARIIRPGGKSIDGYWRPRLMELGYLPLDADGMFSRDITNTLTDLLEQRSKQGVRTLAAGDEGRMTRGDIARLDDSNTAFQSHVDAAKRDIAAQHRSAGGSIRDLDERTLQDAAERVVRGEASVDDAYEQAVMNMPEPAAGPPPGPVSRDPAPRMVQVDSRPVLNVARELQTIEAMRPQAQAIERAFTVNGRPAETVREMQNGLLTLNDAIETAKAQGRSTVTRRLVELKDDVERQMEAVPEFAQAQAGHAELSRPLDPFESGRTLGGIVERDPYNRRFTMEAGAAPEAIDRAGVAGYRDLVQNGTPATLRAQADWKSYQLLRQAEGARPGSVDADALAKLMRDQAEIIDMLPGVRERLNRIVTARRGMAPVEQSPLGQLAETPRPEQQARILFENESPGIDIAVAQAVRNTVRQDEQAARGLARYQLERKLNKAIETAGTETDYGQATLGNRWRRMLEANPQEGRNVRAMIQALPDGETAWNGLNRVFEVLEASGRRQAPGSRTQYNQALQRELEGGGTAREAAAIAATLGTGWRQRLTRAYEQYTYGQNLSEIAELATRPDAIPVLRQLLQSPPTSARAGMLTARLLGMVQQGGGGGRALEITVRPSGGRQE